jgi:dTDP-L-rhamnose 4-epimerase
MNVLVTGGAGFIGSHTVDRLLEHGHLVRVLDALVAPVHIPGHVPDHLSREVEFVHGDVRDPATVARALDGIDAVIHLAAYQDYLPDFSHFFDVNATGTALLYETVVTRRLPIRKVVVASSQAVYGEGKYVCSAHGVQYPPMRSTEQLQWQQWEVMCSQCSVEMKPLPTDEVRVNPHNPYAISKYTQELISLNLGRRYDIPTVCLRYSITQGPRQSFRNAYSGILRNFTVRLLHGQPPVVYEDGGQQRDYTYVGDVAQANVLALEDDRATNTVFNVGTGQAVTVLEYARRLAQTLGVDIEPLVPGHYRVGDTRHVVSDSSRLRALGWQPTLDLPAIMAEYIAWATGQPDLADFYAEAEATMLRLGVLKHA